MATVTIARQLGSGGGSIAQRLADELAYRIVDRMLVERAAADANLDLEAAFMGDADIDHDTVEVLIRQIMDKLERVAHPNPMMRDSFEHAVEYWKPHWNPKRYAAILQSLIRRATARGRTIVLGRGANHILARRPDVVRVFIGGSVEQRTKRLAADEGLVLGLARDIVESSDAQRAIYINRVFRREWTNPQWYDLVFNTDGQSDDEIVQAIVARVRELDPAAVPRASLEDPRVAESPPA